MNSNSFMINGWTITLVSAIFALAANNSNPNFILIIFVAVVGFWVLDGFFLFTERKYRGLYSEVAKLNEVDFRMDASKFKGGENTWIWSIFSSTLGVFYGSLLFLTFFVAFLIGIIQIRLCCCN